MEISHRAIVGSICLLLWMGMLLVPAEAQSTHESTPRADAVPALIQSMAGEWSVTQRMWPGPSQEASDLPPAVAHRRLLGDRILQEEMDPTPAEKASPFTRMCYFEYNAVTRQYEYFSIDSRAPQMMNERSYGDELDNAASERPISLWGGIFVAPKWGNMVNAAFRYRILIGPVQQNRQTVQLYLTPVAGESAKEFLAFEYVYTRMSQR